MNYTLPELEIMMGRRGFIQTQTIFLADTKFLFCFSHIRTNHEIWVLMMKGHSIKVFREAQAGTWFEQRFAELFWLPDEIEGYIEGSVWNKAQAEKLLGLIQPQLKDEMVKCGWQTLNNAVADVDFQQCARDDCRNVVGFLDDPDLDETNIDAAYQLDKGGAICGSCKVKHNYHSCEECEYYFEASEMIRVDDLTDDDYAEYYCVNCHWDERAIDHELECMECNKLFMGISDDVICPRCGGYQIGYVVTIPPERCPACDIDLDEEGLCPKCWFQKEGQNEKT